MKTVNVNLALLQKYFSKDYTFENKHGSFFSKDSYDIENDVLLSKHLPIYQSVSELCSEYDIKEFTDTFFNLYFISWTVKIRTNKVSPIGDYKPDREYKTQLYTLFENLLPSYGVKANTTRKLDINFITIQGYKGKGTSKIKCDESEKEQPKEPYDFQIKDKTLIEQMQLLIMDKVSDIFCNKPFHELSDIEVNNVLKEVNDWLKTAETFKKGGAPKTGHYLKIFAVNILKFIDTETLLKDRTKTIKREFVGKLFDIFDLKKPTNQTGHDKMISNIILSKD